MSKTVKDKTYTISFKFADKEYKGKGQTMLDALLALPMPLKIMSKTVVTISDGVSSYDIDFQPVKLKRLFWKNAQPIIAKQFMHLVGKVKQ